MDRELKDAIKALAEIQKRQGLHTILLTSDLVSGDVVAQIMGPHGHKTCLCTGGGHNSQIDTRV